MSTLYRRTSVSKRRRDKNLGAKRRKTLCFEQLESRQLLAIDIVIDAMPDLAANQGALDAFQRAAAAWEAVISDPITVHIDADLTDLGQPNVIGQTGSVLLVGGYDLIRDQLVADSADEDDESIVAALPTAAQASFQVPGGFKLDGQLLGAKAALKAAGFTGLDAEFGESDATITFNSQFNFDFDNSDGVGIGLMDFETVAAHEIGHALGFISEVDTVDAVSGLGGPRPRISPSVLDLFRFEDETANDPATAGEFNAFPRSLVPGVEAVTDQIIGKPGVADENNMSTGFYTGDGRQASHWKDGDLSGQLIGLLDPTLGFGQVIDISQADLRALDLIGYDIAFEADPNSAPVAVDDATSLGKKSGVASGNVLDNDFDADGDSFTAQLVDSASDGSLVLDPDGSFTYTPGASFSETDSFTYMSVQSDGVQSNVATVTISSSGGGGNGGGGNGGGGRGNSRNASTVVLGLDASAINSSRSRLSIYTSHASLRRDMESADRALDSRLTFSSAIVFGAYPMVSQRPSSVPGPPTVNSSDPASPVASEHPVTDQATDVVFSSYGSASDSAPDVLGDSVPDDDNDLDLPADEIDILADLGLTGLSAES